MDPYQFAASLVRDFGFPTFVAFFVLVRLEPAMREQTRVVRELKEVLLSLNGGRQFSELRQREIEQHRVRTVEER